MTLDAKALFQLNVNDFISDDLTSTKSSVVIDGGNSDYSFDATSTPIGAYVAHDSFTLTGGSDEIDLSAAPTTNGVIVDLTALSVRPQVIIFFAPSTNTAAVAIDFGITNGIANFGTGAEFDVGVGAACMITSGDNGVDLSGSVYKIGLAGTASDVIKWICVFG